MNQDRITRFEDGIKKAAQERAKAQSDTTIKPEPLGQSDEDAKANLDDFMVRFKDKEAEEQEAKGILKSGKPFDYIIKTFSMDHEGDLTVARVIALTFAASSVLNGEGLHVYLSGSSGRGKSHSAETMFQQLPEEYNYNRSFSDKYLFYAGNDDAGLKPGVVLLIDDQTMTPGVQEIFKVSCGKYAEGVKYGTVQNQKAVTLKLPSRVSWVLLKVDDVGDDQVMNRLVQARIQDTDEKVKVSAKRIQEKYRNLKDRSVKEPRREVMICRTMWNCIKKHPVVVEVPCAGNVIFADNGRNLRNHELFFNLIMAHAVINQWQRTTIGETVDGVRVIEAVYEDYKAAAGIFDCLYNTGGQAHNTVKSEDQVVTALLEMKPEGGIFTYREISKHAGMVDITCYKALHGRRDKNGDILGGLLSKCEYIRKAGKRSKQTDLDDAHRNDTQKRETTNEDIYEVDLGGLSTWKSNVKPVELDPGFKWNIQTELPK